MATNKSSSKKTKLVAKPKSSIAKKSAKSKAGKVTKPNKPSKKVPLKAKSKAKPLKKAKVVATKLAKKTKPAKTKASLQANVKTTLTAKKSGNLTSGFTPLLDHILIQPDGVSDRTPGGLFIPSTVQDKPLTGKVLAVGKGGFNKKGQLRPLDVNVGENVIYGKYAGTTVTIQGQELLILKEEDILGIAKSE